LFSPPDAEAEKNETALNSFADYYFGWNVLQICMRGRSRQRSLSARDDRIIYRHAARPQDIHICIHKRVHLQLARLQAVRVLVWNHAMADPACGGDAPSEINDLDPAS
jgi:hypothetical protein